MIKRMFVKLFFCLNNKNGLFIWVNDKSKDCCDIKEGMGDFVWSLHFGFPNIVFSLRVVKFAKSRKDNFSVKGAAFIVLNVFA